MRVEVARQCLLNKAAGVITEEYSRAYMGRLYRVNLCEISSSVSASGCMSLLYKQCVHHFALRCPGKWGREERGARHLCVA